MNFAARRLDRGKIKIKTTKIKQFPQIPEPLIFSHNNFRTANNYGLTYIVITHTDRETKDGTHKYYTMGWFGGDSSNESADTGRAETKSFTSDDVGDFDRGGTNMMSASSSAGAGGGASGGAAELQQMSMVLQQQMLVQQVINDLSDRSYEKCMTAKPTETLTGSQVACVKATVNKWLDTNEFITGRLGKKAEAQQQQGHYA